MRASSIVIATRGSRSTSGSKRRAASITAGSSPAGSACCAEGAVLGERRAVAVVLGRAVAAHAVAPGGEADGAPRRARGDRKDARERARDGDAGEGGTTGAMRGDERGDQGEGAGGAERPLDA